MTIDIRLFEKYVPASRGSSWNKLQTYADQAESTLRSKYFGDELVNTLKDLRLDNNDQMAELFARTITNLAYYMAIPFVDLIQTDTGFAVVSTTNLVPASKDRVAAIRDAAKTVAYVSICDLLFRINSDKQYRKAWLDSPVSDLYTDGFIWIPDDFYTEIIPTIDVFLNDLPTIRRAERTVAQYISEDLMSKLIADRRDSEPVRKKEKLHNMIIRAIVSECTNRGSRELSELVQYLNYYADKYPEYKESDAYQANNWKETPDSKDDTCFFML